MENKVEVKGLCKKRDNFTLGEISFSIPKGFITGFIGKNGAGKTTTIKSLLSLINYEGEVLVDGEVVSLSDLRYLQNVGIVMDEPFLAKDWTMRLVNEAMECGYDNWDGELFFSYLERFEISSKLKVKELSRGMKIKLMLAIALSHKANLLLLDEPTSGLDPGMRDEFVDLIKEYMEDEENTVLFSTHITQDLERIADFIVFIDNGKLVSSSTKDEFAEKYVLVKGGANELSLLDGVEVLGKRKSSVDFEALVEASKAQGLSEKLILEKPDIDKIMVLYGRNK